MQKNFVSEALVAIETLDTLLTAFTDLGATRVLAKPLAANDNSKNQVYLGGGFGALNIIPHGEIVTDETVRAGSVRRRDKALVEFYWVTSEGAFRAPDAQLILYPKYPEVRMSGFLKGATNAPAELMRSRDEGRVLFLGICRDGRVLGFVAGHDHGASAAFRSQLSLTRTGVFDDLTHLTGEIADSRTVLINTLRSIHLKGWIQSQKIGRNGLPAPYGAQNGGGYTLEAELGVSPNGYSEPDFLGWEIKQYGVANFEAFRAKSPVTLMTPEPTGGAYCEKGVETFLRKYGYPDKTGKPGRINFGGIYSIGRDFHADTGLKMGVTGYDAGTGKIEDLEGSLILTDRDDRIAASWCFRGMLSHWNRKHARAAYVPSLKRGPPPEYSYGARVELFEGTDFLLFLKAVHSGNVYYDPAIKMERAITGQLAIKRRSQFRVRHNALCALYQAGEVVSLA
jgi:hypothetical protein